MNKKSKQFWAGYEPGELHTTVDQWRAALDRASQQKYPDGKTVTELSQELGMARATVADKLSAAVARGHCISHLDYRQGRLRKVYILNSSEEFSK